MKKKRSMKTSFFGMMVAAVLCAGTVSAHQLSLTAQTTTCRGFCNKTVACPNVLGCACVFQQPNFPDSGVCGFIAAKPTTK